MRDWWKRMTAWQQDLLLGIGGGLGGVVGYLLDRQGPSGYTPFDDLPDLLDFDSEDTVEPEPPGIEYDDHGAPCVSPPHPWNMPVPVAMGWDAEDEGCTPPEDLEPKKKTEVVFASGATDPKWPLDTTQDRKIRVSYQDVRGKWHGRWGREFGASRKGKSGERVHVGIDLFADPGDVVLAMEDGEILAGLPFYKGTGALYQLTDSGHIINYGELERRSWKDYDLTGAIGGGQRVRAGDPIARVGLSDDGSHMLHLETYEPDTSLDAIRRGDMQWSKGSSPPAGILDPTDYLLRAQRLKHESMVQES